MDHDTRRLAVIVMAGLVLLFPVFNGVAATMLDALRDAEHKASFTDFFKGWDDVGPERKLEYWGGREVPPGQWDSGSMADDATVHDDAGGAGGGGDRGGQDGGDKEGAGDPGEEPMRYVEEVLWTFTGGAGQDNRRLNIGRGHDYAWVNVSWIYDGFTGNAQFDLLIDGSVEWSLQAENMGPLGMGVYDGDNDSESIEGPGRSVIEIDYGYDASLSAPQQFEIVVIGTYLEPARD